MEYEEELATKEELKEECIKRLRTLKQSEEVIENFKQGIIKLYKLWTIHTDDKQSEIVHVITNYDDITKIEPAIANKIKEIEQNGGKVYLALENENQDGELLTSLIYCTAYKDEWKIDHADMKQKIIFAYVYNQTYEPNSEYGSIGFEIIDEIEHEIIRTY